MAAGNSIIIDFVFIRAGTYLMGSPPDEAGRFVIESRFSRSANRAGSNPKNRLGDIGFRLAKDI